MAVAVEKDPERKSGLRGRGRFVILHRQMKHENSALLVINVLRTWADCYRIEPEPVDWS